MTSKKISQIFKSIKGSIGFSSKGEDELQNPMGATMTVKVLSAKFGTSEFEVSSEDESEIIKLKALGNIVDSGVFGQEKIDMIELFSKFKLIRVKSKLVVDETKSIKDLSLENNEEFLLIERREQFEDPVKSLNLRGPTKLEILEKTAYIPRTGQQHKNVEIMDMLLEDDMRKVFITLAQESAYMLAATPLADKLISYYRVRIHNFIKYNKNAMKVMSQLGFPTEKVEHAMKIKANNTKAALDWLIENEKPNRIDESLLDSRDSNRRVSLVSSARRDSILSSLYESTGLLQDRVDGLLEIVKFYAEKDELVYQENINEMVLMGYEVEIAREALRVTRNNVAAAIAQIHGDDNPSITELRHGLADSSAIRKKFLESPQTQQSLSKSQSFLLYINILDNPSQANAWNPFSDMGALMTHIIITYHEEKHILATNQFNDSRLPISALSAPN